MPAGENSNVKRHTRRYSANDNRHFDVRFDFSSLKNNKNRNNNNNNKKQQSRVPRGQGPVYLQNEWAFWYDANNAKGLNKEDYENSIIKFGSFKTVQDFWRFYNNIVDPQYFPSCSNLRIFKEGIKPLWEDPANIYGGQWTIRTHKNETGKMWIQTVLYIIGEQFTYSHDICGVVLSVRPRSDTINIWNKSSNNVNIINTTMEQIRKLLHLDMKRNIVYKKNEGSMSFNASSEPNLSSSNEDLSSQSESEIPKPRTDRSASLDELSSIPLKFPSIEGSDISDISDISDGEAYELTFDSNDDDIKSKHKKSSSFSSSPFPSVKSPAWKQHRKSNSDSHKKSSIIPKYNHLNSSHRRQHSDDRSYSLQKSRFISNYASLQKELYSKSSEFSPYEVDLSELKSNEPSSDRELLSSKQSLSTFLIWTIGSLFLILLWAIFSWQAELYSII